MVRIFLVITAGILFSAFAQAAPCNQIVFNSTYTCPDGKGGQFEMKLTHRLVNTFNAITVNDDEYNQEFISDTSKYHPTPIGQTIGLCSGSKFTVDIYSGSGNSTVQSKIVLDGDTEAGKGIKVSKFVRHPYQSAVSKYYVCLRNK